MTSIYPAARPLVIGEPNGDDARPATMLAARWRVGAGTTVHVTGDGVDAAHGSWIALAEAPKAKAKARTRKKKPAAEVAAAEVAEVEAVVEVEAVAPVTAAPASGIDAEDRVVRAEYRPAPAPKRP